jgi:hypothetical protein
VVKLKVVKNPKIHEIFFKNIRYNLSLSQGEEDGGSCSLNLTKKHLLLNPFKKEIQ